MQIERDKKYFWNIVEVTIKDSFDKEDIDKVLGFHLISEYSIHGNALRKLSERLFDEEDWVEFVTVRREGEINKDLSYKLELADFNLLYSDMTKWSIKISTAKTPTSGELLWVMCNREILFKSFAEVKFNFKPGKSLLYINEES